MNNRLKAIRNALGLNQQAFGDALKLNRSYYSQLENGARPIVAKTLEKIVDAFNVNREWLETGVGEMFVRKPETQSPEEFAKSFGCDDFTAGIFARYCRFSEEDKARFSELLRRLVANPDAYLPRQVPERAPTVDASIRVGGNVTGTIEQKIDNRNGD